MISSLRCSLGSINCGTFRCYSAIRDARILKKFIESDKKKRNKVNQTKQVNQLLSSFDTQKSNRKNDVLNKIYMYRVTELLPQTEGGNKLINIGAMISKVHLNRKSGLLEVYWIAKSDPAVNEKIEGILIETASQLRREIGLIQSIGRPPVIKFIRDLGFQNSLEIDKVFNSPEFQKDMKLADDILHLNLESAIENDEAEPEMRHDLFGLDRAKIHDRIALEKKKKSFEPQERDFVVEDVDPGGLIKFDKLSYEKFYRRKEAKRARLKRDNESLIYHPAYDMVYEEKPEINWEYEEHEDNIDLDWEHERLASQKLKMGEKEEFKEDS